MTLPRWSLPAAALAAVLAVSCTIEDVLVDVNPGSGDSLQFSIPFDSLVQRVDTLLVDGDTVIIVVTDTVFTPGDTVVVSVTDTLRTTDTLVVVDTLREERITTVIDTITGDTVRIVDTVNVITFDTTVVFDTVVVTRLDTVIQIDTVVVTTTDTVVQVDTVVRVDTVVTPPPSLSFGAKSLALKVGETQTVSVTMTNALGYPVTPSLLSWFSTNSAVASTTSSGAVTGKAAGSASVIAVAAVEGLSATLPVEVRDDSIAIVAQPTLVDRIVVAPTALIMRLGESQSLTASALNASGSQISGASFEWSSEVPSIASVSSSGVVQAQGVGETSIRVSSGGVLTAVPVTVTAPSPIASVAFEDGFESGGFLGAVGGTWYNQTAVSVSREKSRTGLYSLKFTYVASPDGDAWAEIRGNFKNNAAHEVWLEWYLYIPTNYKHRDSTGPDNNKFAIIGHESNMHGGWKHHSRIEVNRGTTVTSITRARIVYGNEATGVSSEFDLKQCCVQDVISAEDLGTWVRFGYHVKNATSIEAADGEVNMWKNGVRIAYNPGVPLAGLSGPLPNGYFELMGWANSGYSEQTVFFLDDVRVYSTNPGW